MVNGIDKFRDKFKGFEDMYTLIGGAACGLVLNDAGLDFRSTKDLDIVLIIEAIDKKFGKAFWEFVEEGGYQARERNSGEPEFYRFHKPSNPDYPKEIELFSRKSNVINYSKNCRLMPIHISDEISSLSAILLNDEYYDFLKSGTVLINGIQVLNYTHIIPFKAKAWLDLKDRKNHGESVDSKNIDKHKRDIFRLAQIISENDKVQLSPEIYNDMTKFIEQIEDEPIDLKNLKINISKAELLNTIKKVYSPDLSNKSVP
ncbi:MAG: hypothetical protein IKN85_00005 [Oscillospiraceae bacterium]|nr:hypothetical protein [Oscillospiraceae bacterium]MBR6835590.1 hypothetical protein [Oscillospiraceae bacterium]MBR6923013.1 hypothetical protein [Oscillospiraceae bacterium]